VTAKLSTTRSVTRLCCYSWAFC